MTFSLAVTLAAIVATQSCIATEAPGFQDTDFEALLDNHVHTIVLCPPSLPHSSIHFDELPAWLSKLPVAIELWTHMGDHEMERLRSWTEHNVRVAVLVPWSSISTRTPILKRIKSNAIFITLVKWVFFLKPSETFTYSDISDIACLIVAVKGKNYVRFPPNGHHKCTEQKNSVKQLFSTGGGRGLSALRDKTFVVAAKTRYKDDPLPPGNYNFPCVSAVMRTLPSLNITVLPDFYTLSSAKPDQVSLDLMRNKFDIVVSGPIGSNERYRYVFVNGVTECLQLKFFSPRNSQLNFSVMATLNHSKFFGAFLSLSIVAVVLLHTVERRLLNRATDLGDVFLFLVSAVLGRASPLPASRTHPKTASLCVMWLIAMICIGAYIQSALTSESSIPPVTSAIDTASELQRLVESRRVLPCVRENDFGYEYIKSEADTLALSLHKALKEFPETCIDDLDAIHCFTRSSKGTHVFIGGVLGASDLSNAAGHGLAASSETISHSCQAVLVAKHFPYAKQVVYLARIVSQSGLIDYEWRMDLSKKSLPPNKTDSNDLTKPSFLAHYYLYLFGTLLSIAVLLFELVLSH